MEKILVNSKEMKRGLPSKEPSRPSLLQEESSPFQRKKSSQDQKEKKSSKASILQQLQVATTKHNRERHLFAFFERKESRKK